MVVTIAIAAPIPVAINKPRSAIFKAVALYAPPFIAELKTRTVAAADLPRSPNVVIATLASLARVATKACCTLSCLNVVISIAALDPVLSSPAMKLI